MTDSIARSDTRATGAETAASMTGLSFQWPGDAGFRLKVPQLGVAAGETLFLEGPSGSGKSTLLSLLAGLVAPNTGDVRVAGHSLGPLARRHRDRIRADHLGVIFQQFNLVPYLSPLDNAVLPCRFSRRRRERSGHRHRERANELLAALGLDVRTLPGDVRHLSVGQQQRVAAARALIGAPELILADEPTSALDTDHRDRFIDLLLGQARQHRSAVVFVSHDRSLAGHFDRTLNIADWCRSHAP